MYIYILTLYILKKPCSLEIRIKAVKLILRGQISRNQWLTVYDERLSRICNLNDEFPDL